MLIIAHLSLMITALLCLIAGVGLAMFGRKKKFWLKGHKGFNTAGFCILTTAAVTAFANIAVSGDKHLEGPHHWIGLIAFLLTAVTFYFGFTMLKTVNKPQVRGAHQWAGRLSLPAISIALALGLRMIGIL